MSSATDPYLEWNAAYVLGSLTPSERREYEQHLAGCQACSRAVTSMAGMAGILASVPADSAFALLENESAATAGRDAPAALLPKLLRAAQRHRLRTRITMGALVAACAAMVFALSWPLIDDEQPPEPKRIALTQTVPSPITADVALLPQSWGTQIEGTCRYAKPSTSDGVARSYAMYITTKNGTSTEIASWTVSPGAELPFTAMTRVPADQISSVDIRLVDKNLVLLQTTF